MRATSALPFPLPYWVEFQIDAPVLAFTVGATLLATWSPGLIPAWLSARANPAEVMKEGGRGNSNRFVNVLTRVLVVGQIALTATLLIAATLQVKSVRNQTKVDYGYDESGGLQRADGIVRRRLSDFGSAAAIFRARSACAADAIRRFRTPP